MNEDLPFGFTVCLHTDGRFDVIGRLAAIPAARVRRMQATIASNAHRMHYAAIDTTRLPSRLASGLPPEGERLTDAFDIALEHAWARATEAATVEAGARTQSVDGAALDAALDLFDAEPAVGSWGGPNAGTCMRTWGVPGDCERGVAGTWRLGAEYGLLSIDECTERCRRCGRCKWISHSHAHQQCDWYSSCNASKLRRGFGAETFKTRLVRP